MHATQTHGSTRAAYSLLEMLIVVAIVMFLATLSWPVLRRPFGKAHLRQAAKQLRAELIRTRLEAVRSGKPQVFRYRFGTALYEVGPLRAESESAPGQSQPAQRAALALMDVGDETPDDAAPQQSGEPVVKQIDEEVTFFDPAAVEQPTVPLPGSSAAAPSADPASLNRLPAPPEVPSSTTLSDTPSLADSEQWSAPLVFYPDGRASKNIRVRLAGRDGYYLDVFVRGITGTALIGQVKHPPRPEEKQPWVVGTEPASP